MISQLSQRVEVAFQKIAAVKGKRRSIEERCEAAIELCALIFEEGQATQTNKEKGIQAKLARMMRDFRGKVFTTKLTDQCFRSQDHQRVAEQLCFLLELYGVPRFLPLKERIKLYGFKWLARLFPNFLVPMAIYMLRQEMADVIIPGEAESLIRHIQGRTEEGIRVNLNHLGEAILGEQEAVRRLQVYIDDLQKDEIEYVSVKVSTICSHLNLLDWEGSLERLSNRLRLLYRAAKQKSFKRADGTEASKFVNLDMEEYRDLHLTVEVFKKVLEEEEFRDFYAGIVLQAYLPDSYQVQQELTKWALARVNEGGAPIKARIVKGANLAMERVEASLQNFPQAPYNKKVDVDANFKRMLLFALEPEHVRAVRVGVASHNVFDIAFSLLLRAENGVEQFVEYEMLEGMADHLRRVVQGLCGQMLLYCPVAKRQEFQNAVAYLIRRLDENTGEQNFLGQSFSMKVESKGWDQQVEAFRLSCDQINSVSQVPRRSQNRKLSDHYLNRDDPFDNEPPTDWGLKDNRDWIQEVLKESYAQKEVVTIPLVLCGETLSSEGLKGEGRDPSKAGQLFYRFALADQRLADRALQASVEAQKSWKEVSLQERSRLGFEVAQGLRSKRASLISVMNADAGKIVTEADVEICEAIDFVEYYRRSMEEIAAFDDLELSPKGTVLVIPPWNFPCAIPVGGIFAALMTGNVVLFKPAPETVLVAWHLAQIFWEAGIPKDVLQFINCVDDPVGSYLIGDSRVNSVVLTGATDTAKLFLQLRPDLDLMAETGGKNAVLISKMADRDLAVKDLVSSAFGHAGQKCSAASLAVCEKEVYEDPSFLRQLHDAASSLYVGPSSFLGTDVSPLIREADPDLLRGLQSLEEGEKWLLEPKQDLENPQLWSPGIKMGIQPGSWMHQRELFGPVLGLICVEDLEKGIEAVNQTPYGLTSGIHSLDEREHERWLQKIQVGNCYINRGITGAIVRRQPFGGVKASCFGFGLKPGGSNYLLQFMHIKQKGLPKEKSPLGTEVGGLVEKVEMYGLNEEEQEVLKASVASYSFWWNYFKRDHDFSRILGQDNLTKYVPREKLVLRLQETDRFLFIVQVCAAAILCGVHMEISVSKETHAKLPRDILEDLPGITMIEEDDFTLMSRMRAKAVQRLRFVSPPNIEYFRVAAMSGAYIACQPVLANGRVELLQYLQEISISYDYHRYGNLGAREEEKRRPLPRANKQAASQAMEERVKI